jgi:hypothetical protein
MKRPFSTGMSTGHAVPKCRVHAGEKFDDHARPVFVQRMQGVGEFAPIDREILQHEHESPRHRIEHRAV